MPEDLPEWGRDGAWQPPVPVLCGDEGTERRSAQMAVQPEGKTHEEASLACKWLLNIPQSVFT